MAAQPKKQHSIKDHGSSKMTIINLKTRYILSNTRQHKFKNNKENKWHPINCCSELRTKKFLTLFFLINYLHVQQLVRDNLGIRFFFSYPII